MFICETCADKHLSEAGTAFPFGHSCGPCEICGHISVCKDVKSSWDWAWKSGGNYHGEHKEEKASIPEAQLGANPSCALDKSDSKADARQ